MTAISKAQAQQHLDAWLAADLAVARNQSYSIAGRSLTRANADEIQSRISYWKSYLARLERGGIKMRKIVPS